MNEAVKVAVQIQSDRLCDEAQAENDEFLKTIDENMHKIIKEQVKEQVKVQVSKILSKIEQTLNEQLEAEVLTRSSNSLKTSYAVVADLSEMKLKKILIEKMEGNKSIQRSNEQRNLYKALVEAYKSDKIILDTYGDTVTLKRRHDDDVDKDEEPSAGSDRGIGTPMATKPKLDADLSGNPVDRTNYGSKIGSLMYLTSSRPDIVQAGSSFELAAFSDADHAGCIDTRKSTSGGIQFRGDKLVSWMLKKQNRTAMSSAEAEYVVLSASYAQVITEYQLADMFTKALLKDRFKYLVRRIDMRCLTPAELEVLAKESA
uniref:Retrovirus-related Pol polyprotein from transposon TNT 1-94 n=1 Tax=Tanacetum cinerariifolium TaxID=118510 RepID=A0A699JZ32_TANCI|nr:hypothetical protein [Tanacetum cinerariifolium]